MTEITVHYCSKDMSDVVDQTALDAGAGAQGEANNGQQQQGNREGAPNAQGLITPAGRGLQLLAQASQMASQNGQVGYPTPTTADGRNLFGTSPPQAPPKQTKGAVLSAIEQVMTAQSPEEIKEQFLWQAKRGKEKKDEFKIELLASGSPDIKVCAFVQNGSNIIKVVHGLHKYCGHAAKEYCNTVLGRMGEWTDESYPITIAMPALAAWDWMDIAVSTETVAWAEYVTANGGSIKP